MCSRHQQSGQREVRQTGQSDDRWSLLFTFPRALKLSSSSLPVIFRLRCNLSIFSDCIYHVHLTIIGLSEERAQLLHTAQGEGESVWCRASGMSRGQLKKQLKSIVTDSHLFTHVWHCWHFRTHIQVIHCTRTMDWEDYCVRQYNSTRDHLSTSMVMSINIPSLVGQYFAPLSILLSFHCIDTCCNWPSQLSTDITLSHTRTLSQVHRVHLWSPISLSLSSSTWHFYVFDNWSIHWFYLINGTSVIFPPTITLVHWFSFARLLCP